MGGQATSDDVEVYRVKGLGKAFIVLSGLDLRSKRTALAMKQNIVVEGNCTCWKGRFAKNSAVGNRSSR